MTESSINNNNNNNNITNRYKVKSNLVSLDLLSSNLICYSILNNSCNVVVVQKGNRTSSGKGQQQLHRTMGSKFLEGKMSSSMIRQQSAGDSNRESSGIHAIPIESMHSSELPVNFPLFKPNENQILKMNQRRLGKSQTLTSRILTQSSYLDNSSRLSHKQQYINAAASASGDLSRDNLHFKQATQAAVLIQGGPATLGQNTNTTASSNSTSINSVIPNSSSLLEPAHAKIQRTNAPESSNEQASTGQKAGGRTVNWSTEAKKSGSGSAVGNGSASQLGRLQYHLQIQEMIPISSGNDISPVKPSSIPPGASEYISAISSRKQKRVTATNSSSAQKYREDSCHTEPVQLSAGKVERMLMNQASFANKLVILKTLSKGKINMTSAIEDLTYDNYVSPAPRQTLSRVKSPAENRAIDDAFQLSGSSVSVNGKSSRVQKQYSNYQNHVLKSRLNQQEPQFNGLCTEPSSHQFVALQQPTNSQNPSVSSHVLHIKNTSDQQSLMANPEEIDRFRERQQGKFFQNRYRHQRIRSQTENDALENSEDASLNSSNSNQILTSLKDQNVAANYMNKHPKYMNEETENCIKEETQDDCLETSANPIQFLYEKYDIKNPAKKLISSSLSKRPAVTSASTAPATVTTPGASHQQHQQKQIGQQQQLSQIALEKKHEKDPVFVQKITMYLDFQRVINFSNHMVIQTPIRNQSSQKIYKAYVTKGNNGVLIRAALKNRWWWQLSDESNDYDNINFLWTQWRKPNFFKLIKSIDEQSIQPQVPPALSLSEEQQQEQQQQQDPVIIPFENNAQQQMKKQVKPTAVYNSAKKTMIITVPVTGGAPAPNPFAKINLLINGTDTELLKQYLVSQRQSQQIPKSYQPPPIFSKESYENGIELEFASIRNNQQSNRKQSLVSDPTPIRVFKGNMKQKMHNHMEYNFHLSNKKALYYNMKQYYSLIEEDVFKHLPVTFHIQNGIDDPEYTNFISYFNRFELENPKRKNVWIIKPGESSNRGNGIQVAGDVASIRDIIRNKEAHQNGFKKTYIIQKYLDKPFLYNKRKFDIRCFMLMTNYNNKIKVYWYQEGYIRTSTKEFTLKNLENRMIHLTNEAVQKRGDDFGKFENGNKLSYTDFQKYIDTNYPKDNLNFMSTIYPEMKKLAYDSVCSVYTKIDKKKRNFSFELFGLDFMIDEQFKTWLIEINTNPSLTIAAPLMSRLLPALIDNVLKIAIDPIFPPPNFPKSKKHLIPEQLYEQNKFDLLFDADVDGSRIEALYANVSRKVDDQLELDCKDEEVYDDDDIDQEEDYE